MEEVEVPAGKCQAVMVLLQMQPEGESKVSIISWYAAGIGTVKQTEFLLQEPSVRDLSLAGTRTVALMASPLGQAPLLAASALPPLIETSTLVLEKFEEGK
jgi:hypothetical protein